ncbi:MAG: hypothetical protein WBI77_03650 [Tepidanaerobacteraceae bacterium]
MSTVVDTVEFIGYKKLAAAIIRLAAEDVLMLPERHAYRINAEEFFESEWFNELADLIDLDPDCLRDKLLDNKTSYKRREKRETAIA